jgi:prepilin-type N-terminal cleavage/methylation domain-containing protein
MNFRAAASQAPRGFTLIEVIVMITIGALVAAVVVPFLGTALTRSAEPLIRLRENLAAQAVMNRIDGDYRRRVHQGTLDLEAFRSDPASAIPADEMPAGVGVTATFITYRDDTDALHDVDGDGVCDPIDKGETPTLWVRVTVTVGGQVLRALFGG